MISSFIRRSRDFVGSWNGRLSEFVFTVTLSGDRAPSPVPSSTSKSPTFDGLFEGDSARSRITRHSFDETDALEKCTFIGRRR